MPPVAGSNHGLLTLLYPKSEHFHHAKGLTPWLPCLSPAGIAAVLTSPNMVLPRTESRSIVVARADDKVVRIQVVRPMLQNAKKKSFALIKNVVVRAHDIVGKKSSRHRGHPNCPMAHDIVGMAWLLP